MNFKKKYPMYKWCKELYQFVEVLLAQVLKNH